MVTNLKRPFIISMSIILGVGIIAGISLYFLAGNIDGMVDKIVADRTLIDKQTGALAVDAALKAQAPQAAVYEAAMEQLLPTQDGLIDFSQWIAGAANNNHVSANVSFGSGGLTLPSVAASGQGMPGQASFSLSATGDLDSIIAFLNDIESQAPGYLFQITSFDLANPNGNYTLQAQGIVFFRT